MCCKMLAITVNIYKNYGKSDTYIWFFLFLFLKDYGDNEAEGGTGNIAGSMVLHKKWSFH